MKKIMFNDPRGLTKATISGHKTMTRRIVPHKVLMRYGVNKHTDRSFEIASESSYKVGEVVAVAQSYKDILKSGNCKALSDFIADESQYLYDQLGYEGNFDIGNLAGWNNKLFVRAELMPHRIKILSVRAERLQDISDQDCLKEGVEKFTKDNVIYKYGVEGDIWQDMPRNPRDAFASLIDKVSGKGTWESNPFVWVYEYELIKNTDEL